MNKIIIALGMTLAASTGAFAESNFGPDRSPTTPANELVEDYNAADSAIDYTPTASIEDDSETVVPLNSDDADRVRNFGY